MDVLTKGIEHLSSEGLKLSGSSKSGWRIFLEMWCPEYSGETKNVQFFINENW